MADIAYFPGGAAFERRPGVGYLMVASAATLFAFNGTVSKIILLSGLSALRLTEARCTGALIGLAAVVIGTRRQALRTNRRELTVLAVYGLVGVALIQAFYYLAIRRLEIGIALLLQYLAPLLVALWAHFVVKERVRRRIWLALALSLAGLSLMVDLWRGVELDGLGILFSLLTATMFAMALLIAERAVGTRDPLSLLGFGFLFASVFWAIAQPWWWFPWGALTKNVSLLGNLADRHLPAWALVLWVIVLGTIAPFILLIGALRHLPATKVGIVAMLEPVLGALVAYAWLDERLAAQQLVGGAIVLAAIFLAQTAR